MKKILLIFIGFLIMSCDDYLDIVPDKTQELSLLFERKEAAYTALVTCYSYMPQNDGIYSTYVLASDELTTPFAKDTPAIELMKGEQNADNPIMGYWSGYSALGRGQESLFKGIRACNTLIQNIDNVLDMTPEEKLNWKSEAIFLKAYYHFLLLIHYGPIPIVDVNLPISSSVDDVKVRRELVDDVFQYIFNTVDLSIDGLIERNLTTNSFGRIDKVIAKSFKSRVSIYYASPMFNGNTEIFSSFTNENGEHYFNQIYDETKWNLAAEYTSEAIQACLDNGLSLYKYNGQPAAYDYTSYSNSNFIQKLYDLRYLITDKWNSELIWGNSKPVGSNDEWWNLQAGALMKDPSASRVEAAWQWVAPTMRMAELYYTKNGLPIDEDIQFNFNNRYSTTYVGSNQMEEAQRGQQTAILNLNREPRFYSNIGFDRGFYRGWGELWRLRMKKGESHGRIANSSDYLTTGYSLKKIVHPDSEGDSYGKLVDYPWPLIRLAELYLSYAEALNEISGPSQEVFDAINKVRARAGIPMIDEIWSNPTFAKTPGKHTSKDGLREIIQQERMIELAFEGHRYYDLRRWLKAHEYFNTPVFGWSVDESERDSYYQKILVGQRTFLKERDYLHPIKTTELTRNSNLIQNPNW